MKIETKNNLKIVLIIVGLFSVSVILFLFKGYEAALYYTIIGIPLFFIAFAYQYIKSLRNARPDPGLTLKTQELEKISYDFKNLQSIAQHMKQTYGLEVDDFEGTIKTLANRDLPLIGVAVVETEGKYVTNLNEISIQKIDLDTIDNVAKNISDLDNQLKNRIKDFTHIVSQTYISYINNLKAAGYNIEASELQTAISKKSETGIIEENVRYLDGITLIFKNVLLSCLNDANRLKQKVKELGKNVSTIESEISIVQEIIESKNYKDLDKGVASLIKIMHDLESSAGSDFDSYKTRLLFAIEKILAAIENKIDNESSQKLFALESQVSKLKSASKISELQQIEPQIIPFANGIAREVYENILNNENKIKQTNFPQLFYPARQPFETDYNNLSNELNVSLYSEKFSNLLRIMIPIMETSDKKSKIIAIYSKIEPKIKSILESKGFVAVVDLKVKSAEGFMELYGYIHPEVTYDNYKKILSSQIAISKYGVSVKVLDGENQPISSALVSLKLDEKIIGKEKSNNDGKVILGDLNVGFYKLIIKCDGYKSFIKKIDLDKDQNLEIKLDQADLGETLCKDIEDPLKKSLQKFTNIIQKEIDSKKYITSTYDFKIKSDYIPCLLYLWAKNNEKVKFIKTGSDYMIYNIGVMKNEFENFVEDIEIGKKEKISDLVDGGFLSAPIPVEEIFNLIDELKKESDYYKNIYHDSKLIWKTAE